MSSYKLLIVDDEIEYGEFISEVAKELKFDVTAIDDPLDFASTYSIQTDIIILDLFMPNMDGIELLRFLSENNSKASIIFISGKDMSVLHSAEELANEYGVQVLGVLQKPFRAQELEDLLTSYTPISDIPFNVPKEETLEYPILRDLNLALENKEFSLAYQPQINMQTKEIIGVEALIRWQHPVKSMIPPGFFIPLAEENYLIKDVTRYVVIEALKQQQKWQEEGLDLRMSINFSPKLFDDLNLPETLSEYVDKIKSDPSKIVLEVTETALNEDTAKYIDVLTRLRMKGFQLSIDDFGTGYSSLQQLVRAPFSELKIDQAFVRKLDKDKECLTIAEISILLAKRLGMTVVAEGIEDENIWNILKEMGCEESQGYWMGRPMKAEDLSPWVAKWKEAFFK